MKTIYQWATCLVIALMAASCTNDMEYKDAAVSSVSQLYEPEDAKSVQLVASATASLYFEWAPALAEDSGSPLYEVVFDKEGGDFSQPIYRVVSDDNGTRNYATIPHKTLNKIAAAAGIDGGLSGTVIWTVMASRGLNTATSTLSRKLTITRLAGFAEVPNRLYVTGEGSEGGTDITKAVQCSSPEAGVFEIFTRLEAGKGFKLADNNSADAKLYHLQNNIIVEGDGDSSVDATGVYRITFDFTTAAVKMTQIKSMGFWFCPDGKVTIDMPYVANGVFQGQGVVSFKQESWGRDQRYKFLMIYSDGTRQMWGTANTTDSNPGAAKADDPYFYMAETPDNQWDQKWKLNDEFDGGKDGKTPGVVTRFSAIFNGEHYTHHMELVK